ncbi:SMP-30/gluconolactonase/LRE family protein [Nocardia sp. NBC_00565]|uniref:SMP-30/gluconolactonase/LRE family protein n=1 Tax=Nocardia sp. NBC_00565 TaxID=2975993 RepID=UPI002E80EB9B|nr:SMP-30/gluconolactonase/LRE family protein [Nocardia sp. NBC_00565]WUC04095.1 SMP-30/gluconolactonase/LRE family protein [Nocardia sp. NBC_00565]
MIELRADRCSPTPGRLCEGPVWDDRTDEVLWVDIPAGHIHRAALSHDGVELEYRSTVEVGKRVSAVVPCASGGVIATAVDTFLRIDDGAITEVAALSLPDDGIRRRLNDAKADPSGRLLAGTMSEDEIAGTAALYRLDPDGALSTLRQDVTISNGLGWSPDGSTLYYADSPTHRVDAFDYDSATGTFSGGRTFAEFPDGLPDGLTVDTQGFVWVAVWGAGQVRAFDPAGRPHAVIDIGPSQVSSCAFVGRDLDVLVITTAATGSANEEQDAGRLFTCRPGVTGLPTNTYSDAKLVSNHDN